VTGLPLRAAIARLVADRARDAVGTRRAGAVALGLDPQRVTLLVSGGSLGAVSVNHAAVGAAGAVLATDAQVLHLAGRGKGDEVLAALVGVPGREHYHVLEYLEEMERALAVADLVVGRAGAGTVCELAALGIPAVYVPLPIGNGEQRLNAALVVAAGGGLLVEDADLTSDWVADRLPGLLVGPGSADRRARMAAAAASVGIGDGAQRVADLVERAAGLRPSVAGPAAADVGVVGAATADGPATAAAAGDPVGVLGRVHLVGVGGAGMSAIALLLLARGLTVSGSDAVDGPALPRLRAAGVDVHVGHDGSLVDDVDTVVVSSAVRPTNPELARAGELGLQVLHRSEALAALMAGRRTVAVAGAHGKTTTSAMIAAALVAAGEDPSFAIGGSVRGPQGDLGGARDGGGPFVAEADESDGSFLHYAPQIAVVTNVEPDHLDHYGSREAFEEAFVQFAARVTAGGLLITCADDAGAARLAVAAARPGLEVRTYGRSPSAQVRVGDVRPDGDRWSVDVVGTDGERASLPLPAPGDHNGLDAAAAWTALRGLGLTGPAAARALAGFEGTGRRFEERGRVGGVRVLDDYAHHPTEVAALLRAARQVVGDGRVVVLFQPHLFSRTRAFAEQFGAALDLADEVVVTAIYAAREDPDPEVTGELIAAAVPTAGKARYSGDRLDAARAVAEFARPGDLVLTVGAGDVTTLGPVILDLLADGARS